ncbi:MULTISPECIES: Crp/Fnr family transcriptional regulator [unclassified Oceanispirochaeta]|uniref:Crp/Fnr family transcriptional regulator n=1 Tax=unclassified Oceanispirochaeta TaxID=2635722 RepID=UPI000E08FC8F|nr:MULTISPECIES: Crp/Fnr family transcriptional regulator [unclassified Oceanispirochaeta]MBF9018839.1 Crp/Fnr family transcriptional regulator [Oceanispirochaeta sp. M2]NPD75327.1 Crp/Fnr family transcriptional regulator [Oceanispirochaeta sp. M1]RDG28819.1 Crp/Fnr family transcriptional regulator [Oceanispirochaeta sp. M1]
MALDLSVFNRFAVTFKARSVIFCEYEPGDSFYLIQSGKVKIVKIFGEIEKTIDILQPGEFFGEMALLEEAPRSATIIAVEETKLLEFNRENFEILMQGNPQIALKLLKLFAKRIYDQKRRFQILTLEDVLARVADVFLMLSEGLVLDKEEEDQGKREFHTTIDDIAHWAGMSPEECRKTLDQFVSQRRLEVFDKRIVVKNINDFKRFVTSSRNKQEKTES